MTRDTVLVVSTSYPTVADGSEAAGGFVADFALALSHHLPVRVVGPGSTAGVDRDGPLPVWRFAAGGRPLSLLSPARPAHWPLIVAVLASLRRQVLAADADQRVLHTLALWALPSGWAARLLLRRSAVPYSVWALGSDIWTLGRLPLVRQLLRGVCRDATATYADGLQLAADATAIGARPFEFMPSCRKLDGARATPPAAAPPYRLLFLGRWHPNKGVDLLLEALEQLHDADWSAISEVHIAGGGPLQELVQARVHALQAAGRPLRLSGFLDRAQCREAFASADRLLLPSRIESIPVVFSDALAFCVPIVSMPVGDLPGLLGGGAGWVADGVSATAFADALRRSLATQPVAGAIEAARRQFDVELVAARFAQRVRGGGSGDV
jgi:glycosyltransferase involved in cell wall biosynthesis